MSIEDLFIINTYDDSVAVASPASLANVGIFVRIPGAADPEKRVRTYTKLTEVATDFATWTLPYKAAKASWKTDEERIPEIKMIGWFDGETAEDAYNAAVGTDNDFYGVIMASVIDSERKALADVINSKQKLLVYSTEDANTFSTFDTESADLGGYLTNATNNACAGIWHHRSGVYLSALTGVIADGYCTFKTASVAQIDNIEVTTVTADTDYSVTQGETTVTFNSGGAPTDLSIRDGLLAALIASNLADEITFEIGATDADIKATAKDEGTAFILTVTAELTMANQVPNVTLETGLRSGDKLVLTGVLVDEQPSVEMNDQEIEPTILSNDQFKIPVTETGTITGTITGYARADFPEAAWMGKKLPKPEGGVIWAYAQLDGQLPSNAYIDSTKKVQLKDRLMHYYEQVQPGKNWIRAHSANYGGGLLHNGDFIDLKIGEDWLKISARSAMFELQHDSPGYAYDAAGYEAVQTPLEEIGRQGWLNGYLEPYAENQYVKVEFIAPKDVPLGDKQARKLPAVKVRAKIRGKFQTMEIGFYLTY